ncbi:carbon monoxide dehydrogenase large chain [Variibacter gotjawalensis]|uniref:Carbon monoxide dehydrogenase large chain n=1 Tax=Variibacter gotjawalensis TaxID=1333996 RepID=A0A0S3PW89_9BRAD|nr:xanthine dehydrogenase family protein molybdopterin-binding subunit [Variibacter gotjawalensis]NIK46033.1 carbon-monoxide dehydrogenase large subunit [Variibacter gotjawalensis]RZS47951.1 carbon-monoxide dehydrogenase large subunit [Variibacter gotjawalensis]BAT60207.1 carbon monoxide dehydrogenase large chain [Variibacter gotjawalensis]
MNIAPRNEFNEAAPDKFGVGQSVLRTEDPVLVQGQGNYTDDISLPRQVYAVMVRSPHAHGIIKGIDVEEARKMPGVLAVYTSKDMEHYGIVKNGLPLKSRDGTPMIKPVRPMLPVDKVRFAGEVVAAVIAETVLQGKDAAEAVVLDIEPLEAVTGMQAAAEPDAPELYEGVPNNLPLDFHFGDAKKVEEAFSKAAHVTKLKMLNSRVIVSAMEPRACLAEWSKDGAVTLRTGCQGVFNLRNQLMDMLSLPADKVTVFTGHVGGSFGMKAALYPEYIPCLHASRELKRPVKWTADRGESFLSDCHGRDMEFDCELALDKRGRFLAWRYTGWTNIGAYLGHVAPLMGTMNIAKNVNSIYRAPAIEVASKAVFTNTTFVSAYRGAGRPEGNYFTERMIDVAADEMGIDRIEMRRRNLIQPTEFPYKSPSGNELDSGDFPGLIERALEAADWKGFKARKKEAKKRGKLRGIGIGPFLEVTAPAVKEMGGLRFEADGTLTFITGTLDYGQGHAASFAQVVHQQLGVPFDKIRLLQGDSREMLAGGGTGGSRSGQNSATAALQAGEQVIEKGKQVASHLLEASVQDIEFKGGQFTIAGTDRSIGIMEIAQKLRQGVNLPPDAPKSLDVSHVSDGVPSTFPNGCHIAEIEIDEDTGIVRTVSYITVNDFGTQINPMLVEGQLHGGVVQGIGQCVQEMVEYDAEGQLLTGSYMDYGLPRASQVPSFTVINRPVPAKSNPLGIKGCGEAGCAGALTAMMNAINDAVAELGIRHLDMPATPAKVWQAIQDAKKAKAA